MTFSKLRRRFLLGGALVAAAATVVACSSGSSTGSSESSSSVTGGDSSTSSAAAESETTSASAEDTNTASSGDNEATLDLFSSMTPRDGATPVDTSKFKTDKTDLTIGYVGFGLVNSWRVQALGSVKQAAEKLGVKLVITDAGGDATKQISDAEDVLARGVDALLISPVAPDAVVPVLEKATASGIPVIVWGSDVNTDDITSRVVSDDKYFGEQGAEQLIKDMGGTGKVIMLRGIAGNSVEQARYDGAASTLKQAGIEIVGEDYGDWAYDKGKKIAENLIAAHPDINGIWSSGAEMTRGAIDAMNEAGLPLVPMSGENQNGFLKLAAKVGLKTSGPVFPTWQGPEALKLAVRALHGEAIDNAYLVKPPTVTDAEAAAIADVSDDYWVEDYLTLPEIKEIFPN